MNIKQKIIKLFHKHKWKNELYGYSMRSCVICKETQYNNGGGFKSLDQLRKLRKTYSLTRHWTHIFKWKWLEQLFCKHNYLAYKNPLSLKNSECCMDCGKTRLCNQKLAKLIGIDFNEISGRSKLYNKIE